MLNLFRAVFAPPRDLILLVAAAWVGAALSGTRAARRGREAGATLDSLISWMAASFVVGGRLLYAASHLSAFAGSPLSLVSLNINLFDAWAGVGCAAIVALMVGQRRKLALWMTLDELTPLFATLGIGLALSHLASGAAFGRETSLPWAITLWGAARHPTQIYELIAALITLAAVSYRKDNTDGRTFLLWVALAATSRLVIEGFRGDSTLVLGGLRLAQVLAWPVLAAALLGFELRSSPRKQQDTAELAKQERTAQVQGSASGRPSPRRSAKGSRNT